MNKLAVATTFLIGSLPLLGSTDPNSQQLFATAEQQASLFQSPGLARIGDLPLIYLPKAANRT
jgi:hypothetical protein